LTKLDSERHPSYSYKLSIYYRGLWEEMAQISF